MPLVAGSTTPSFHGFAALNGLAPRIGSCRVAAFAGKRRCWAVRRRDRDREQLDRHGGPAMIEGGGLGTFTPEKVGRSTAGQEPALVDVRVADDRRDAAAKRYLGYFAAAPAAWSCADQAICAR